MLNKQYLIIVTMEYGMYLCTIAEKQISVYVCASQTVCLNVLKYNSLKNVRYARTIVVGTL